MYFIAVVKVLRFVLYNNKFNISVLTLMFVLVEVNLSDTLKNHVLYVTCMFRM